MDSGFRNQFWKSLDSVITISNCEIYSYSPASEGNEDIVIPGHGFAYFFYNKKLKKIVFFNCNAVLRKVGMDEDDDDLDVDGWEDVDDDVELEEEEDKFTAPSPATIAAVANLSVGMSPLRLPVTKEGVEFFQLGSAMLITKESAPKSLTSH